MIKLVIRTILLTLIIISLTVPVISATGTGETGGGYLTYQPDGGAAATSSTGSLIWQFARFIFLFAFVVGLVFVVTRWLGQRYYRLGSGKAAIQVLDVVYLGPKRAIYIVDIGTTILLLGVTEQQINLLTELSDSEQLAAFRARGPAKTAEGPEWLSRIAGKVRSGSSSGLPPEGEFNNFFTQQIHRLQRLAREEKDDSRPYTLSSGQDREEEGDDGDWLS
ncbi:MAG: flagellar biosynthetic protein FliO [bacterium]|jgi:flagellar protein FliO/FliZ